MLGKKRLYKQYKKNVKPEGQKACLWTWTVPAPGCCSAFVEVWTQTLTVGFFLGMSKNYYTNFT